MFNQISPAFRSVGESRRMNLNDGVVYRCLRLGPLHQLHPGRSRWSVTTIAFM
jgi:hypothetical protein